MEHLGYFIFFVIFLAALVIAMERAKRGWMPYCRPIVALAAIEEGVQRAAEMQRPVHFSPGQGAMERSSQSPGILAGLAVLGHIAEMCAKYRVQLMVSLYAPETVPMADEILKTAYLRAGYADEYSRERIINFYPGDSFRAAAMGLIERERPAANFLIGSYAAESLLLAETGHRVGALQVGGTQRESQLPFLVAICDYVMIGEEMLVSSAYLSEDRIVMASFAGQDVGKLMSIGLIVLGSILTTAGITVLQDFLNL